MKPFRTLVFFPATCSSSSTWLLLCLRINTALTIAHRLPTIIFSNDFKIRSTFGRAFVGVEIVLGELEYVVVIVLQRISVQLFLYVFHLQQFLLHSELSPLVAFDVLYEPVVVLPIGALLQV